MKHRLVLLSAAWLALLSVLACDISQVLSLAQPTRAQPVVAVVTQAPVPSVAVAAPAPTSPPQALPPQVSNPQPTVPVPAVPTPTPVPPQVSNPCTNSSAMITSPNMDSTVSGMIEILGTASRPDMDYWKVEFRPETSTAYDVLYRSQKPIIEGVLARFSTKTVPNGVYWLQLAVVGKDGNFGTPCQIKINIAN